MDAYAYASDVLTGREPACKWVRLACERFNRDLERSDLVFDDDCVADRVGFFDKALTLENGSPFSLPPWQQFIVANLYGWFWERSLERRFHQALIMVPRKNAKSTFASGMGISSFFMEPDNYKQYYCFASDRGQASLLKDYGEGFIRRSDHLPETIRVLTHEMRNVDTKSKWKAQHADWRRLDGLNPYWVVFDEFHSQETEDLDNVIESAFGSQPEYLYIKISTAGEYKLHKPCVAQQRYGEQVLEGVIENDAFFYVNYTIDDDDVENWTDEAVWRKANPNLGVSKSWKYMREQSRKAIDLPSKRADFLTKQLNVWVEGDDIWITQEKWNENGGTIDEAALSGLRCYGGLDLSKCNDLTALAWLFPPQRKLEKWFLLVRFFVPRENMVARQQNDGVPYIKWRDEGWIESTDGNATSYQAVRNRIAADAELFDVQSLAVDRWQSNEITQELMQEGLDMVPYGQGFKSMSVPTDKFERLILDAELNHGNNPVLRWNCSNTVLETDAAENRKPNKKRSPDRIDGMVAAIMALGVAIEGEGTGSVYEERDIRTL